VCRQCGVGGDVIDLMMHVHRDSFIEACKRLTGEGPPGSNGAAAAADFGGTQPAAAELEKLSRDHAEAAERDRRDCRRQREKAEWLWCESVPITGTIGEVYFRARGYRGVLPTTLRFLPARDGHPPAVIAAFGLTSEIAPGVLAPIATDAIPSVHLIKLKPDGSDRIRDKALKPKITIGRDFVAPIVLAPPNDLLALTIGEGIEKVLADHAVSGAGAWASASAGRMPALADLVPSYIECVTVLVDNNDSGRKNADALAARLHARGFEVLLTPTREVRP
jgi:hypothetical protein